MSVEIEKLRSGFAAGGNKERTGGVKISTVELKTPEPNVTRTVQIKTGFKNIGDYTRYLQGRYGFMNSGSVSMRGIPVTVSVSGAFLAKCNRDPEKAKYLEENLAAIPDCIKSMEAHTKAMPGSPVCTYAAYAIDENGNISCMSGCTNNPDGRIARENAERKAGERHKAEKKLEAKRREKAALQRRAEKERFRYERRVKVSGSDVRRASDKAISEFLRADIIGAAEFCLKV